VYFLRQNLSSAREAVGKRLVVYFALVAGFLLLRGKQKFELSVLSAIFLCVL